MGTETAFVLPGSTPVSKEIPRVQALPGTWTKTGQINYTTVIY